MTTIQKPDIISDRYVSFAEHEVLLSFVNDDDAVQFRDWWRDKGFDAFVAWAKENPLP